MGVNAKHLNAAEKKSAETQVTSLSSELARTFGNETENSLDEPRSLPFSPIDSVIFSLK